MVLSERGQRIVERAARGIAQQVVSEPVPGVLSVEVKGAASGRRAMAAVGVPVEVIVADIEFVFTPNMAEACFACINAAP